MMNWRFLKDPSTLDKAYPEFVNFLCPGLGNPGHICYFNSLLQTFASSTQWSFFFNQNAHIHPVFREFANIINSLREPFSSKNTLSSKALRALLKQIGITASISRQQDFHEFYILVLAKLETLFRQSTTIDLSQYSTHRIFPSSFIYTETIKCSSCNQMSCSINGDSSMILEITQDSLASSLQHYFGINDIESTCSHCSRTSRRQLTRQILFPPKSLLFYINRRRYANIDAPSLKSFSFPAFIDIEQYCFSYRNSNSPNVFENVPEPKEDGLLKMSLGGISEAIQDEQSGYQLTSVISFRGKDNAGHYMCYKIHRENEPPYAKRWVCANDNTVTPTTLEEVLNSNQTALLLHYEIVRHI